MAALKFTAEAYPAAKTAIVLKRAFSRERLLVIILASVAILCLAHAVYFFWIGLRQPLIGFREAQTAISAYWMWRGGPWIAYETPVLGYPWSIPFEFPTYQWMVALLRWMGIQIEVGGRIVSFVFYVGCLGPLWMLGRTFKYRPTTFFFVAILFLLSPIYVFWGRSVMIETCALFFCLLWLSLLARLLKSPTTSVFIATIVAGSFGTLTKVTTFPAYGMVGGLVTLAFIFSSWRDGTLFSFSRLRILALTALAALIPIAVAYGWVVYSDHIKGANAIGLQLTSEALSTWNFGTLPQRFSSKLYQGAIVDRLPEIFGYGAVGALIATGCAIGGPRYCIAALAAIVGFLTAFLLFPNLHIVHPYYQTANAALAIVAVGLGLANLLAKRCGAKTRSGKPCQSPVVRARKRCRMHGGAHGSGAPSGERNGNYRHGLYTAEAVAERKAVRTWLRSLREP